MSTVYLAGGFKSGWQDHITHCLRNRYIDPRKKNEIGWSWDKITAWDKYAIRKSDIVFAYLEKDNPSGIGLACECAYANALGKLVILVNEKENTNFISGFADFTTTSLQEGLDFLDTLP